MENEIFITIEEFPEYAISNLGNCKKIAYTKGGYGIGKLLTPKRMRDGYIAFRLNKNKKQFFKNAHRLVAIHFISNPENKKEVNHKNLNKNDNKADNLEWVTAKENMRHARKNKTWERGRRKIKLNFKIPGYYPGMTLTKEGKKEYMRHYRKLRK